MLKADKAGDYSVVLNDGSKRDVKVDTVANAVTPEKWSLTVESWTPVNEFGVTGKEGALTAKNNIGPVELTELKAWKDIPEIGETVSGVGTYTTTFTVDGPSDGATLSLGNVFDTVSVKVNGIEVAGINQSTKVIDLGELVKQGENTLEIQSVSTLRNVVRTVDSAYNYKEVQSYGLLGPVSITPYVTAAVVAEEAPDVPVTPDKPDGPDSPNTGVNEILAIVFSILMLASAAVFIMLRRRAVK